MQAFEALREAASREGIPLMQIGRKIGRSDNYVSIGMSRGSVPRCDTMAKMAGVCGYSLVLCKKDKVPSSAIVID